MHKILLVDDEENVLHALRRELRGLYEIEVFTSAAAALDRCRETTFDLVISDYQMPEMNGVQFLIQVGQIQPDTARLVLSGQANIDALVSAINETHIYRFLAKPWDREELQANISQALAFRTIVLENRRQADDYRLTHGAIRSEGVCKRYRVILVDGDPASLMIMRRGLLQDHDYEGVSGAMRGDSRRGQTDRAPHKYEFVVDAFSSAHLALEHAKHHVCDLVIAAQILPDMDGIQLLAECRQIHPDGAHMLVCNTPDKSLLAQAINEVQIHSFISPHWSIPESHASPGQQAWDIHQMCTAVMQALTARDLLMENRKLADLHAQR